MKCIIPCAGYATRLYPLTHNFPKALLEVQGKPILGHIVRKVEELNQQKLNVDEIFIITNNKYFSHFQQWADSFQPTIPIKILNDGTMSEQERLGQIGDINHVIKQEKIDDDILIIAGDNLFNFSLGPIYQFFQQKQAVINGLYDAQSLEVAKQQGNADIKDDGQICSFEEKPENPKSTFVSLGIYFFPKSKVQLIQKYLSENNNPDKMGYFMIWLLNNESYYGHVYKDKWFDIGWKESLELARKEFKP